MAIFFSGSSHILFIRVGWLLILLMSWVSVHADNETDLLDQISAFQHENNITIAGQERIKNTEKVLVGGNLEQQIKQLFADYNYVTSRNAKGKIERIVILSQKQPRKDDRILLPTSQHGNHSTVSIMLSGDGRVWQTLDMVVDTGADLVVLPESLINQLGLSDYPFRPGKMQTANGLSNAKVGVLKTMKLGGEAIDNVAVAFIADQLLGENKLLGMSVLDRFQVNIDEREHLITLIKKP